MEKRVCLGAGSEVKGGFSEAIQDSGLEAIMKNSKKTQNLVRKGYF